MPIHDWTRVGASIFHAFHHEWISALARALNAGLLPEDYYALPEQFASRFGPDVLTLRTGGEDGSDADSELPASPGAFRGGATSIARPRPTAETEMPFYRRKQKAIMVRHTSGDNVVAVIEIVSRSKKAARTPLRAFVEKAAQLLDAGVNLLILDLHPPGRRDARGIHSKIWEEIDGTGYSPPADKPLTLVSYDSTSSIRAYVVNAAVGDKLTDMPLFLDDGEAIDVPLEATYLAAFTGIPVRWRRILETSSS